MSQELGHELTPYESVRERILEHVPRIESEEVGLVEARGRVLATDVVSQETIPPFDNSAMDGYALRSGDLDSASEESPITLPVDRTIAAGATGGDPLRPGHAVRIMTGAPLPPDADAVVPHELTRFTDSEVTFSRPVPAGRNVRAAGGDIRPGETVLRAGRGLGGPQIAVAATVGACGLCVARRPKVAILSPGNELVEPWDTPAPGQIRNSNAHGLSALVADDGGEPDLRGIVEDSLEAIRRSIRDAIDAGADVLLSTGGVSAGDFDFVKAVVGEDARPGMVFKTDMRPGKPQVFGLFDGVPFLGLPGNPAAAIVSYTVFVRPVLRRMLGAEPTVPEAFPVRFGEEFRYKPGRVFMLRARVEASRDAGGFVFGGAGGQDSSFLSSLADANAIVRLPADRDLVRAGEHFPAQWI